MFQAYTNIILNYNEITKHAILQNRREFYQKLIRNE